MPWFLRRRLPPATSAESRSSIELTRNAKGDTQVSVKVYRDPGQEDEALEKAIDLYTKLCERFVPA